MGSLNSFAGALVPTLAGAGSLTSNLASWALNGLDTASSNKSAIKAQKLAMQQAEKSAQAKLAELDLAAQESEADRLKTLKAAIAKQKASFGGSGISSLDSGSTQSVITGFLNDSEEEKAEQDELTRLKKQSVVDSLNSSNSQSLLELSQLESESGLGNLLF